MRRMLALDPARRISPDEALAHPFLARIDPPRPPARRISPDEALAHPFLARIDPPRP